MRTDEFEDRPNITHFLCELLCAGACNKKEHAMEWIAKHFLARRLFNMVICDGHLADHLWTTHQLQEEAGVVLGVRQHREGAVCRVHHLPQGHATLAGEAECGIVVRCPSQQVMLSFVVAQPSLPAAPCCSASPACM